MKKILLSMAAILMCGTMAFAEDTTLQVSAATDIQGTDVPEVPAEGSSNGQARHIQPLESLKIDGYSFTFSNNGGKTEPAYYYPMSTKPDGAKTIRLYVSNSMTLTAPAGVEFAKIVGYNGSTETVVYNGEKTNTCTYDATGSVRFDKLVVSTEATQASTSTFEKVTALETGEYVFVCDGKIGVPAAASATYGRISLVEATIANDKVETEDANAFTITVGDGKATIKDANGRYYSMDNSHFTSFQFYTDNNDYNYWTFAFNNGEVTFTNTVNTDCIICQSKGNQGTFYTNLAPAKSPQEFNLPQLYKKVSSGVATVAAESNSEAVYYNLQGVRVANPEKGLYIMVKDGKSTKMLVK